jgi:hypothetical protein
MPINTPMKTFRPLIAVLGFYLLLVVAELAAIFFLNGGVFTFVLDDPYIHLAVAENLRYGHYGVNLGEFSAPSSSILWPFLLFPIALLQDGSLALLVLNVLLGGATLLVAARLIRQISDEHYHTLLLMGFLLVANPIGLAFTGMEHNLQVLLATLIACGIVEQAKRGVTPLWLWLAIIAAPLVRYESLALSGAALLWLFCQKEYAKSIGAGVVMLLLLATFSFFLLQLGLGWLPDSVLAKSRVASSGAGQLFGNLLQNFKLPNTVKTVAMALLALFLLQRAAVDKVVPPPLRLFLFVSALALLMQLFVGRVGWYFRYEIHVWVLAMVALAWLYFHGLTEGRKSRATKAVLLFCGGVSLLEGVNIAASIPLAASNIYHQQYQMHRFLEGYYQKPVAVNDLGLSSWRNQYYVLDLWGLGSSEARVLRKTRSDALWMDELSERYGVELVMIYHNRIWFPEVPPGWVKVAELDVTGWRITVGWPVTFYARSKNTAIEVRAALQQFAISLPEGSRLQFPE